ncbi:MAG: hypothetical protein H8E55_38130, partial [Pelagibacterales bacterium]|nr:hypothetical protein [Pelagibacterales bacterium]
IAAETLRAGNAETVNADAKVKFVKEPNYTKKVDVGNFVVNNSKLRALGWKPKINLNQGIKETLEYFKSEKIN